MCVGLNEKLHRHLNPFVCSPASEVYNERE